MVDELDMAVPSRMCMEELRGDFGDFGELSWAGEATREMLVESGGEMVVMLGVGMEMGENGLPLLPLE